MPTPPDARDAERLEQLYVRGNYEIRPVVAAILRHPALYDGPRMVKSPVLYNAGLLRRIGRPIDTTSWVWLDSMAGQQLFYPPNVAGWDETRWLDTATWRGRWWIAQARARPVRARPGQGQAAVRRRRSSSRRARLLAAAGARRGDAARAATFARRRGRRREGQKWKQQQYPPMAQNALRHLIAVSPELQAA